MSSRKPASKREPYRWTTTRIVIWAILIFFCLSIVGAAVAIR